MSSPLSFAILILLAKEPMTGYQISRSMQRPLGYFWTARHSQIYPELAELEADGLARSTVIAGPGPRDTKRYAITREGKKVLTAWLDGPPPQQDPRDELMLRVWSLWLLSPERAAVLIRSVREQQVAALDISAFEEEEFHRNEHSLHDPTQPAFGEYATLRFGVARRRATVEWCDWLLAQLAPFGDPG